MREQGRISLGALLAAVLLAVVGALLVFYHLGKTDFYRDPPARIAVYARQMNLDGAWLVPVSRGQPRIDVPPLYLWAVKLTSFFSPTVGPLQSRLPSAICALLLILLVARWLHLHLGRTGREDLLDAPPEGFALLAGLILATNPELFTQAREGTLQTMFTLAYVAAAFCWGESLEARRSFYAGRPWRTWILWGYALAGLAMLVHGPLVLLLLWVPYLLAARSYHLRHPGLVHLYGFILALLIGGSWPLLVGIQHPQVASDLWRQWLSLRLGRESIDFTASYHYLTDVLLKGFPWIILAIVMVARVWSRRDRSPTLVFWANSLVGSLIVLTGLSSFIGRRLLPVMVFTALLAGDALYRWNFENAWAWVWRILLRVVLIAAIVLGIFASLLLSSVLGLTLFILLPLVWLAWAVYTRRRGLHFTPWEVTIRLAVLTTLLLFAGAGVWLSNWEPRRAIHNDWLTYFRRIQGRLFDKDERVFLSRDGIGILYDYYLNAPSILTQPLASLRVDPNRPTYLLADRDLPALIRNPRLDPETFFWGAPHDQPSEGMFRILPAAPSPTSASTGLVALRNPWRVAILGNTGTRSGGQRAVARRLGKMEDKQLLDDALLLGNNLYGPSLFDHLDFIKAFEQPYARLLKNGVVFHAALGPEDQSHAWVQTLYTPFHMHKARYYVHTLGGGLVDIFMLDGESLGRDKQFDETQLRWLENALAASRTPWKIVGLGAALLGAAANVKPAQPLADRLLPLFDRYRVNLVAWAGGRWYERFNWPGRFPVFLNAGWSGGNREAHFRPDPARQAACDSKPGFVYLEFLADRALLQAVTSKGQLVEQVQLVQSAPGAPMIVNVLPPAPTPTPALMSVIAPTPKAAAPGGGQK